MADLHWLNSNAIWALDYVFTMVKQATWPDPILSNPQDFPLPLVAMLPRLILHWLYMN